MFNNLNSNGMRLMHDSLYKLRIFIDMYVDIKDTHIYTSLLFSSGLVSGFKAFLFKCVKYINFNLLLMFGKNLLIYVYTFDSY